MKGQQRRPCNTPILFGNSCAHFSSWDTATSISMALRRYHRLPWAFLPLFCTNKSCWYVPGFACCPDRFKRSEYRWNRHINSQCKADMDQLGLVWPVDDATVLQKGDQGALFSIPLRENIRRETRPGESPINNERELKLTAPTDTTLCLVNQVPGTLWATELC